LCAEFRYGNEARKNPVSHRQLFWVFFVADNSNNASGARAALLRAMEPDLKNRFQVGLSCFKDGRTGGATGPGNEVVASGSRRRSDRKPPVNKREERNHG
jgi:hypothetical protein